MSRDIVLSGGGPWGFTLSGGKDFGAPLKVSKITAGGKAAKGGIRFGDYIIEINGDTTEGLLHSDAMMLIKTTGVTLTLKVTKEMPRWAADSATDGIPTDAGIAGERPCPPPIPANTALPQKTTIVMPTKKSPSPVSPEVKTQPSNIAPESGLDSGGSSTQQSPAFKRIHIEKSNVRPSVFNRAAANAPPPSEQMRDIVIDDGNVVKTSQRPQPPSSSPSTVTKTVMKVSKASPSPVAKPPPPATSGGTTQVGGQQPAGASDGKLSTRQGVCEACQEPIRGPFASAMGKVWHPEHFACSDCQKSLQNTTFIFEEQKIFCEDCYQKNFAQICATCNKPILGSGVSAVGLHWHQEHFKCSRCSSDLSKGFQMENNQLFCADCYGAAYGAVCFGCSQKIGGDVLWVEALDHQWHPDCFVCDNCRRSLDGATFFVKLGRPYCKDCN